MPILTSGTWCRGMVTRTRSSMRYVLAIRVVMVSPLHQPPLLPSGPDSKSSFRWRNKFRAAGTECNSMMKGPRRCIWYASDCRQRKKTGLLESRFRADGRESIGAGDARIIAHSSTLWSLRVAGPKTGDCRWVSEADRMPVCCGSCGVVVSPKDSASALWRSSSSFVWFVGASMPVEDKKISSGLPIQVYSTMRTGGPQKGGVWHRGCRKQSTQRSIQLPVCHGAQRRSVS